MICIRYLVLALVCIFFVISLVATTPLPLYELNIQDFNQRGKAQAFLWDLQVSEVTLTGENSTVMPRSVPVRINYAACEEFRATFRSLQAFSIGGTIFGFYATLLSLVQCFCRLKVKLPLFIFIFLATLCELVFVIIAGVAYNKTFCSHVSASDNFTAVAFKSSGYQLSTSFILHVVALVGYLVCLILTPFTQHLWCGKR